MFGTGGARKQAGFYQVAFWAFGDEGVVGVDHVADVEPAGLGEQLVGVKRIEAVIGGNPADQFRVRE